MQRNFTKQIVYSPDHTFYETTCVLRVTVCVNIGLQGGVCVVCDCVREYRAPGGVCVVCDCVCVDSCVVCDCVREYRAPGVCVCVVCDCVRVNVGLQGM